MKERYTRVIVGQTKGEWKLKLQGLGQGDTLSPILTAMFTNDYVRKHPKIIKIGSFVDDFAFWQNPITYQQTPPNTPRPRYRDSDEYLQDEIDHFLEWCHDWQLDISIRKCSQFIVTTNLHVVIITMKGDLNKNSFCL